MKRKAKKQLDFEIDKLTNSIENAQTGEVFDTEVVHLTGKDIKQIKKSEWQFDWHNELKYPSNLVFKLTTANNPTIIQGLTKH